MYCDQVREISRVVLQYSHCTCDTALGWAHAGGASGKHAGTTRARAGRAGGKLAGAGRRAGTATDWHGRGRRAAGARGARQGRTGRSMGSQGAAGRAAGPASCALGALNLF